MAIPSVRGGKSQGVAMSEEVFDKIKVTGDSQIGSSATTLLSFYGGTAVDQPAAVADTTTTAATSTTNAYGYTTAAQADAIVTAVNAVVARLRENGLIAT